jgi:uncharacterized protein
VERDDLPGAGIVAGPDLSALPLLDHHCHGVVAQDLDRATFEALLTEGTSAGKRGGTLFDSGIGMEVRRRCAPVLGLEPFASPDAYLERRSALGWSETSRRFLSAAGLSGLFVDTGLPGPALRSHPDAASAAYGDDPTAVVPASGAANGADAPDTLDVSDALGPEWSPAPLTDPSLLGRLAGAPTRTVLRLEAIAEELAAERVSAAEFPARISAAIERLASGAVAAKTIAGYRSGLALPARLTGRAALSRAVSAFLSSTRAATTRADPARTDHVSSPRLTDPTIIRFLIGCAIDNGLPLQIHTGYGNADLDLSESDPTLLTPLLRELEPTGVPVFLLHTYPFQRHAGYLAQIFDNVFCDVGLAIPHTGHRAGQVLAELLELAPYGKVLYSSDAFGLPELYYLGAELFRSSLSRVLGELDLPADEAARIALMVAQGNAQRAYHR